MPFLREVSDLGARYHNFEDPAVDLPVAELAGPHLIHAEIGDVQPVAEIVKHEAGLAVEGADGPRFPEGVDLADPYLFAPVP